MNILSYKSQRGTQVVFFYLTRKKVGKHCNGERRNASWSGKADEEKVL